MNGWVEAIHRRVAELTMVSPARAQRRVAFETLAHLHDGGQRQMVASRARFRIWNCGRRFGKTKAAASLAPLVACAEAGVRVYYVSTSIKRAAETVWDDFKGVNRDFALAGRPNESLHSLSLPNHSRIVVTGVEDKTMADDLRGRPRVALWIIDECQDWKSDLLRYFYEQVVFPSLADVRGGVVLAGTGGPRHGWWYERSADDGFEHHRRSIFDNPTLPAGEARVLVDKACKDRGCDEADASIRREFYGEFATDAARQVFGAPKAMPARESLPRGKWSFVIGADFGTVDAAAVVVWGWTPASPKLYVLETQRRAGLGAGAQVELVRSVAARYQAGLVGIVGDPGGGGAGLIVDLRREHQIGIQAAEKQGKAAACIVMRDGLRSGKIEVVAEEAEFIAELQEPEWNPDAIGQLFKGHMPDRVDAALYGYRRAIGLHHYVATPPDMRSEAQIDQDRELDRLAAVDRAIAERVRDMGLL